MKSLSKATFHLLCCILLLGTFQSCKDDETTPPPPGESATLTISDVKAEANTVTFTITPKNVDVYTYTIKSATVTPQATVQDPAETKTFTYNSLLPSSDYTIVATGFTQGGLELTSTEYKFRTLDTQDPGLEVPSGEEPFIEYGDQRIAAKSVFFYKETDRLWFFISPLEGYDNYQDMLYGNGGKNDYISLSFTPNQLNKSINMKSASERYSLLNSMSFQHPIASDISMVTIDYHSLITDGGFIVTRDGDKIEGYAEMTSAATGKKLRIYGTCTYDQQDAERTSFISLNDLKTPLGSAYYQPLEEETISEIHLSPASPVTPWRRLKLRSTSPGSTSCSNSKSSILPNKSRLPSPIRTFKARRAPSPSTNTPCKTTTESRSICRFMICTSKGMRTGRSNYTPTTPATVIRSERTTRSNSNPPSSTAAATITTRSIWHPRPV